MLYVFQKTANSSPEFASSGLDGSHTGLFAPTSGQPQGFVLSPDSKWVVFEGSDGEISSDTPTGTDLSSLGNGTNAAITPDSSRVLFESPTSSGSDLFSEQIFGGDQRNLTRSGDNESAGDFQVSPDSRSIVFAFQLADGSVQLGVSDGTEAQEPTTTTTTLPAGGSTTTLPGTTPTTLPPPRQEDL